MRYAEQLVKEGLFHKASTYYLAANKVYEAINMLKEKKLFKWVHLGLVTFILCI